MKTRTSTKISATWIPIFSVFSFIIGMLVTSRSLSLLYILTSSTIVFFFFWAVKLETWVYGFWFWENLKHCGPILGIFFWVQDVGPTGIKRVAYCAASAGPTTATSDLRGLCNQEGNVCFIFLFCFSQSVSIFYFLFFALVFWNLFAFSPSDAAQGCSERIAENPWSHSVSAT